mmetsp:Transcript_6409/g.11261  ORF Transcript_6409/g.11261 Transcript_6409/m.11261 type:complete len:464 (-) Transcript_6409:109-1500(-)
MKKGKDCSAFQKKVYGAICCIPKGKVSTYSLIGKHLKCGSAQAIGQALKQNPFAPEVPCHRVISSQLKIGGYCGNMAGPAIKKKLSRLDAEGVRFDLNGLLLDAPTTLYQFKPQASSSDDYVAEKALEDAMKANLDRVEANKLDGKKNTHGKNKPRQASGKKRKRPQRTKEQKCELTGSAGTPNLHSPYFSGSTKHRCRKRTVQEDNLIWTPEKATQVVGKLLKKVSSITSNGSKSANSSEASPDKPEFFSCNAIELAQKLLGCRLVRRFPDGRALEGTIVETEAYLGLPDKAAHTYGGKVTEKNKVMMQSPPGSCYVYLIYGMYFCLNIVGINSEAVLIRAIKPASTCSDQMAANRHIARQQRRTSTCGKGGQQAQKPMKSYEICSGPGKLCDAMEISKHLHNGVSLCNPTSTLKLTAPSAPTGCSSFVASPRIGIAYAQDWASVPLRLSVLGNKFVSKPWP